MTAPFFLKTMIFMSGLACAQILAAVIVWTV